MAKSKIAAACEERLFPEQSLGWDITIWNDFDIVLKWDSEFSKPCHSSIHSVCGTRFGPKRTHGLKCASQKLWEPSECQPLDCRAVSNRAMQCQYLTFSDLMARREVWELVPSFDGATCKDPCNHQPSRRLILWPLDRTQKPLANWQCHFFLSEYRACTRLGQSPWSSATQWMRQSKRWSGWVLPNLLTFRWHKKIRWAGFFLQTRIWTMTTVEWAIWSGLTLQLQKIKSIRHHGTAQFFVSEAACSVQKKPESNFTVCTFACWHKSSSNMFRKHLWYRLLQGSC